MRWCARCDTKRLADCSILCFAERVHDNTADLDHPLYISQDQEPHGT